MNKKQYKVIVTPFAEAALQAYDDYLRLELFADQAADDWIELFGQEAKSLAFMPEKFPPVEKEPWHSEGIHCHPVKGINIYFWINAELGKVYITDVVSQRMNQDKRLIESCLAFYQDQLKAMD